jgi:alkylation response protein AidB-like acyl-CoA dehydrogenase
MDFSFTREQDNLRREFKEFAAKELPPEWTGGGYAEEYGTDKGWEIAKKVSKKLAARGWLTMAWPREYGGLGTSKTDYLIYREEMAYNIVPGADMGVGGVSWIGQSLILFGTEEQKNKHLPGIARGDVYWCTGYSEPEAGSDLAALKTRAIRKGDEYVVNGQKVWTSAAHRADWCWLAVRTNPDAARHKGISVIIVDMKTPGVTVNPLVNLAGNLENSEVFFDDVHVPAENLVGQENDGWRIIMTALSFERTAGIDFLARNRRLFDELVKYCKDTKRNGTALSEDGIVRSRLAEFAVELELGRLMCYNIAAMEDQGLVPGYEASACKNFCAELGQSLSSFAVNLEGLYGQLEPGPRAPLKGLAQTVYLFSVGDTIGAGTSEVNRNVIAQRGLGLPRM